jgi:hypothetical protein
MHAADMELDGRHSLVLADMYLVEVGTSAAVANLPKTASDKSHYLKLGLGHHQDDIAALQVLAEIAALEAASDLVVPVDRCVVVLDMVYDHPLAPTVGGIVAVVETELGWDLMVVLGLDNTRSAALGRNAVLAHSVIHSVDLGRSSHLAHFAHIP